MCAKEKEIEMCKSEVVRRVSKAEERHAERPLPLAYRRVSLGIPLGVLTTEGKGRVASMSILDTTTPPPQTRGGHRVHDDDKFTMICLPPQGTPPPHSSR